MLFINVTLSKNQLYKHQNETNKVLAIRRFISLRAFTVYMQNSLRFEILLRSFSPK